MGIDLTKLSTWSGRIIFAIQLLMQVLPVLIELWKKLHELGVRIHHTPPTTTDVTPQLEGQNDTNREHVQQH
jgi:hypothetical protein